MNAENGPKMLPKRELISAIKEYDDRIAEEEKKGGGDLAQLISLLDDEKMNYTDEQWALLTQIANAESGHSGLAEGVVHGNYTHEERAQRKAAYDQEFARLQQRWKDVFGDEQFEW